MPVRFAPARVEAERRADGATVLRSPLPLPDYPRALGDLLVRWAAEAPERTFLAERAGAGWRSVGYGETLRRVRALGQALLDLGASPSRPVLLLSDNSIDHGLLQLAAMHVGVPAAPVSPAYSLQSRAFEKLRAVGAQLDPGVIFAADGARYGDAIAALGRPDLPVIVTSAPRDGRDHVLDELASTTPTSTVDRAFAALGPDTIAKVLFTSGSTGAPKGVVNTQRMLCSNQAAIAAVWPFLDDRPPVLVDWLPWSHTFGGNHDLNLVLMHGGTLHVDDGRPTPQLVGRTVENLRLVSPTLAFNVPRGFDALLPHLEDDEALRTAFFRELDLLFYAAAALPPTTWKRLENASIRARGAKVPMASAWGSTETSPMVTTVHFPIDRAGVIGLPAPGCMLKLAPVEAGKLELRVRGPNVTPGHWRAGGGVTPIALDDEGFLPMGDAGRLEDERTPSKGVVFEGRTAENFKLSSGTWVSVGALRIAVVAACAPLVADAIVAGHDRDEIGVLLVPSVAACTALAGRDGPLVELLQAPAVRAAIADALAAHGRAHGASSTRVARARWLVEPLSIDAGEITDKGYVNQGAVLARRAAEVARLQADPPPPETIVVTR